MNNWTLQSLCLPRSFFQYWCFLYDWAVSSRISLLPPNHPCPLDHQCCLLLSYGFQIHLWYLEVRQFWKRPNEEFYCFCWTCICDGDSLDVRGECPSLDFRSSFSLFFFYRVLLSLLPGYSQIIGIIHWLSLLTPSTGLVVSLFFCCSFPRLTTRILWGAYVVKTRITSPTMTLLAPSQLSWVIK